MEKRIALVAVLLVFVLAGCKKNKIDNLYGRWRYDVEDMKKQAFDLTKTDTIQVDTIKAKLSLDTLFKPLETLIMEYQPKGIVLAHINDTLTQKGTWRLSRDEKYFVTRIEGLEKIYEIDQLTPEKLVFKETVPNATVKRFVLYPAK